MAEKCIACGDWETAKLLYFELLELDGNNFNYLYKYAYILCNLKLFKECIEYYELAIKINDTSASGFYEYGIVHKELNNINKAIYLPQQFASISINIQSKQLGDSSSEQIYDSLKDKSQIVPERSTRMQKEFRTYINKSMSHICVITENDVIYEKELEIKSDKTRNYKLYDDENKEIIFIVSWKELRENISKYVVRNIGISEQPIIEQIINEC
eukprot:506929_1